jgi:hypothetical protein
MDQVNPEGVVAPEIVETPEPQTAPDGAVAEAQPEPKPESHEPKGIAKRLKELTDARRASEAREERLLRLLEQRESPPPQEPKPKTLQDFNYDENAYREHLYTEARREAEWAARTIGERVRAEQEAINRRAKFDERVEMFAKTVEDYHEVVNESTPVSEAMADAIMDSDEAGALMYYLGTNLDIARKIYHMSPAKAGREIQRIEDQLIAERKRAAQKPVSKAPPPTPKIEGKEPGNRIRSTDPEALKLSGDEWARLRERELAAERKARRS